MSEKELAYLGLAILDGAVVGVIMTMYWLFLRRWLLEALRKVITSYA